MNKKILAIGIVILFIVVVFTPSINAYKYFLKPVASKICSDGSDLVCWGELNWTNVVPGETVYGRFTVRNAGKIDTLYWEISEWPEWGIWDFGTFFPKLPPGGHWIVFTNLTAPKQGNASFTGHVKVVNKNNASDYCIINASLTTTTVIGFNIETVKKESTAETYEFDRYMYPEFYDCYSVEEIPNFVEQPDSDTSTDYRRSELIVNQEEPTQSLDGPPMDSPWPMHNYDARHTGRSPYYTIDTWDEIWHFKDERYYMHSSPVIDNDGTIYCSVFDFYALYPNGTLKWTYDELESYVWSAPAIDENGIIYFGNQDGVFYAVNPNGTRKWRDSFEGEIMSSPAIGDDGTIYFCNEVGYPRAGYLNAMNPNGTIKWRYKSNHLTMSSPAIGLDGTIYFGSIDEKVYAVYPNGTLKWNFNTGTWVHGSASIGDDGTVYIGSDNSFYALYPNNGTMKWKLETGPIWNTPVIDNNGIIYVGSWYGNLYAIYPNGTIKWSFDTGGCFWFANSPALSAERTIYFGTNSIGGGKSHFFALYPDGTEKWCKGDLGWFYSSPAIGEDGVVYACSCKDEQQGGSIYSKGYLYAFGIGELEADANGPYYGLINEPVHFKGTASGGYSPHSYHWDFGDTYSSDEQNPIHTYTNPGKYTVTLTVTDNTGNTSEDITWAQIQVSNNPPNAPSIDGVSKVRLGVKYYYDFTATDDDENPIWYFISWGDGNNIGWLGPYNSGEGITLSHTWWEGGCTLRAKAKDIFGDEGPWGELIITPRHKTINNLFMKYLERFPFLERLFINHLK